MSIRNARENNKKLRKNLNGWNEAIRDAKRKIRALEDAIRLFRERMRAGEPWPGDEDSGNG